MGIRKFEIERLDVKSSKPFETVLNAVKAGVGRLDLIEFAKASHSTDSFAQLEKVINRVPGKTGLMLFMELDHGAVLSKDTGSKAPRNVRWVVGNPLIMKEMVKHVPDAGSYAPVTVLVDERPDGVYVSYDRMSSLLAPYGNPEALKVAQDLDRRVEGLLREATA